MHRYLFAALVFATLVGTTACGKSKVKSLPGATDYSPAAFKEAVDLGKPIFIMATADW